MGITAGGESKETGGFQVDLNYLDDARTRNVVGLITPKKDQRGGEKALDDDTDTGRSIESGGSKHFDLQLKFENSGYVLIVTERGELLVWDPKVLKTVFQEFVGLSVLKMIHLEKTKTLVFVGSEKLSIRSYSIQIVEMDGEKRTKFEFTNKITVSNPHEETILDCCEIGTTGRSFATCSEHPECEIKIWRIRNGKCKNTKSLMGHKGGVFCIASLRPGIMVSGSSDMTLRIWDYLKGKFLYELKAHRCSIIKVRALNENQFISLSKDGSFCIWAYRSSFKRYIEQDKTDDWKQQLTKPPQLLHMEETLYIIPRRNFRVGHHASGTRTTRSIWRLRLKKASNLSGAPWKFAKRKPELWKEPSPFSSVGMAIDPFVMFFSPEYEHDGKLSTLWLRTLDDEFVDVHKYRFPRNSQKEGRVRQMMFLRVAHKENLEKIRKAQQERLLFLKSSFRSDFSISFSSTSQRHNEEIRTLKFLLFESELDLRALDKVKIDQSSVLIEEDEFLELLFGVREDIETNRLMDFYVVFRALRMKKHMWLLLVKLKELKMDFENLVLQFQRAIILFTEKDLSRLNSAYSQFLLNQLLKMMTKERERVLQKKFSLDLSLSGMKPKKIKQHADFVSTIKLKVKLKGEKKKNSYSGCSSFENLFKLNLVELWKRKEFTNFQFNSTVHVHREVMILKSNMVYQMLQFPGLESSELSNVDIEGMEADECEAFVTYLYTGEVKSNELSVLLKLLQFSIMYFEVDMKEKIEKRIKDVLIHMKGDEFEENMVKFGYLLANFPERNQRKFIIQWSLKFGMDRFQVLNLLHQSVYRQRERIFEGMVQELREKVQVLEMEKEMLQRQIDE